MMSILGRVLSICPLPDILAYLDEVLLPRVTELQELAHQLVSCIVIRPNFEFCMYFTIQSIKALDTQINSTDDLSPPAKRTCKGKYSSSPPNG